MDEAEKIYAEFLDGNEDAFSKLVSIFAAPLTSFIRRYVNDYQESEDIMVEVFFDLYVKKSRFKSQSSFKTYLFRIARNKSVTFLRKSKKYVQLEYLENLSSIDDVENATLQKERNEKLFTALKSLKKEYREIVVLVYIDGLSYEEVGKVTGKSKKQIANVLYRAKLQLKSLIGDDFL